MATFSFTITAEGMTIRNDYDVGYLPHLNCSGVGYWEDTVSYNDNVAEVYFGYPFYFYVRGNKHTKAIVTNSSFSLRENTLVIELSHQPALRYDSATLRR
jgi:hypothetical protein